MLCRSLLLAALAACVLLPPAAASAASAPGDAEPGSLAAALQGASSEASASAALAAFLERGSLERDGGKEAVEAAMSRGWWGVAARLLEAAGAAGVDVSTAVHQTASRIQTELQALRDLASKKGSAV